MNGWMKKAGLGAALAATALSAAVPADAQRWGGYRHYNRGGGNAAAGALLGGIVGLGLGAVIANGNRGRVYDRGYYGGGGYGGYGGYNGYYAPPPPPPPVVYDRGGYYGDYYPRCYDQWRIDPYYGQRVRVRVCD